jgi:hypothetical protein
LLCLQLFHLNNTALLGEAAMDENAEPKAMGNQRAAAQREEVAQAKVHAV